MQGLDLVVVFACVGAAAGFLVWKLVLRTRPKAPPVKLGSTLAAALEKGRASPRSSAGGVAPRQEHLRKG